MHSQKPISSIHYLHGYKSTEIQAYDTVYICGSAIPALVKIIEQISVPFILLSGDADESCPDALFEDESSFLSFINRPNIIHWFAQNCTTNHEKLSKIPIGMDYHTMAKQSTFWGRKSTPYKQELALMRIAEAGLHFSKRMAICYANFQFHRTEDRLLAMSEIPAELVYYEPKRILRKKSWETQSDYAFVLSPHGNGLDCHRTWEALILGCIVIVKTSPLDELYEHLPVLLVQEWSDITAELLNSTMEKYAKISFEYERLTLKYWMDKINAFKNVV